MITRPNCKINLGLRVVRRRADGYHDLESFFVPVPLCDTLEIVPADHFDFVQDGIAIDAATEDNLVVRAYRLMQREYGSRVGTVAIKLTKNIPFGAGLGGGSSDAAFTIRMVNDLFSLQQQPEPLCKLAARIGADCPFFIVDKPAYVTGIGDMMAPVDSNPIAGMRLVMAMPDATVSTAEAYRGIVPRESRPTPMPDEMPLLDALQQPITTWNSHVTNDFEHTVFKAHPVIRELKEAFLADGAQYASMSGSGASVFALYDPTRQPSASIGHYGRIILNTVVTDTLS